jgi:hypothetical protein
MIRMSNFKPEIKSFSTFCAKKMIRMSNLKCKFKYSVSRVDHRKNRSMEKTSK